MEDAAELYQTQPKIRRSLKRFNGDQGMQGDVGNLRGVGLIGLGCAIGLASCSPLQTPNHSDFAPDEFARIDSIVVAAVRPFMAEYDVPGIVVAVTFDDRSLFFSYGVTSKESGVPVDEATIFEIGSASKAFTGTLVAYAQALGKLSLEDRPSRFLPQLEGSAVDGVSLLQLGTYTAGGLPLQFPQGISDDAAMIRFFQDWKPDSEAGLHRRYSNPSIGLLGRIAGLSLESDFSDAVQGRLLPQLGLSDSYIRVPDHAMARYAWGYDAQGEPVRVNPGMFDAEAYGIKSTAADMIRFVQVNIDPSHLPSAMRRAVEDARLGHFRVGDMVQGLGWEQYPYPIELDRLLAGNAPGMIFGANPAAPLTPPRPPRGPTLFNKTGSTGGFGAYVAFVPEQKIGIVMLANRNFPIPARIGAAHEILGHLASMEK